MHQLDGYDVVIVGGGTAGLPTALRALEGGLRVLILEKSSRYGGTLWYSGGSMSAAGTRLQQGKGYTDSWEAHFAEANRIGHGLADQELLTLMCQRAAEGIDWLEDLGVNFGDSPRLGPEHELYDVPRTHYQVVAAAEGTALPLYHTFVRHLQPFVAAGQLLMLRGHRAVELLVEAGTVAGVEVENSGGERIAVRAPAVVLASGGYTANRELHRRFTPDKADVGLHTNPEAMGDGLLMAERIGAKLTHTQYMNPLLGGIEDPRNPGWMLLWVLINLGRPPDQVGDIFVNREGRRFVREDHPSNDHKEKAMAQQPGMVWFAVFDDKQHYGTTPLHRQWMLEVEGRDVDHFNVKSAGSIADLAQQIGCDAAVLEQTVADYNAAVAAGRDEAFGREKPLLALDTPPFHAVRARCNLMLSRGGVKIDTQFRVVRDDAAETPIPGLYAVGEVIGNGRLSGDAAVGGFGVGPAITFGKLLGEALPAHVERTRATRPVA